MDIREAQERYDNRLAPEPEEPEKHLEGEELFLWVMDKLRVQRLVKENRNV